MPMGIGIGLSLDFGGKVGLFLPTAPADADYAFLSHPTYWASDASHIVPCAAGDAIRWWKDAVTETWYEQATSGSRHIARLDATGKWYAENDGTKTHPWVDLSGIQRVNGAFAIAYRLYASTNFGIALTNGTNGAAQVRQLLQSSTTLKMSISIRDNTVSVVDPVASSLNTDYRHIGLFSGTTSLYRNGTSVASNTDTSSGNYGPNTWVGGAQLSNFMNGRLYGILIATSNAINVATWDTALHSYCAT